MATKQRDQKKAPEAVLFGDALRRRRTERGWSQERLAEAAGITLNYVGNLERGEQGPSLHILVRLARALDTDLPALLAEFSSTAIRKMRL
ncbi:MAG TPA: helix-turn-helix transcriptional regulator [Thermoanaerobaculia bacterium]|jgi:transcriptional regulator with XRE-family HTH domain|nr:helix-turn-helix transcriptional regulator [Thermoanaerobaculia bacterium]